MEKFVKKVNDLIIVIIQHLIIAHVDLWEIHNITQFSQEFHNLSIEIVEKKGKKVEKSFEKLNKLDTLQCTIL